MKMISLPFTLILLLTISSANRALGEFQGRKIGMSTGTPYGGSGSAQAPNWDNSWAWGSSPTSGWGFGSGSGKSPNGFGSGAGFGFGYGTGSGSGFGYGSGDANGAGHGGTSNSKDHSPSLFSTKNKHA